MKVLKWVALGAGAVAIGYLARPQTSLQGKVAIVTGGSRGLGLAIAQELAGAGAKVVICARNATELAAAEAQLRQAGAEVLAVTCDVSAQDETELLVQRTIDHFGALDIVVNNAGIIQVGPLESLTVDNFRQALEPMFWGMVNTTMAALPHLRARKTGHIVNITSIGGKISVPHMLPYSSAKFAATGFSEGLRAEVAKDNIKVTTVVPGLMRTGSDVQAEFAGDAEKEYAWFAASASIPGLSMDGRQAAARIVRAIQAGRTQLVLTLPAKAAVLAHGLAPALTQQALALVNRLLPSAPPGTELGRTVKGTEPAASAGPGLSRLTALNRQSGEKLNQPT
jgi:NAD(P)-dependent dehydrogenase (short-subunit alcohol dehydrogenase family)